jgi:hypothetical protein
MNTRIIRAIFMEHATRSWPFLASGLLLSMLLVPAILATPGPHYQNEVEPAAQAIALVIAMLGLLYSAADGERLTCELTERTLLLPVPTIVIVTAKFVYNTASIFLVSLLVHALLRLTVRGQHDDWWAYPVLSLTMFVILQTLALAVGCLGDWSFGILVGAIFVVMACVDNYATDLPRAALVATPPGLFVLGLLVSTAVVHLRRTGRWDPELLLPRLSLARSQANEPPLAPFKSALDAQRWFETRRMSVFLLTTYIGAGSVGFLNVIPRMSIERFLEDYSKLDRLFWAVGQFGMSLPFAFILSAFFAGGVMFFQNYRMQFGPLRAFLYLRPMSSADLARARIAGTLRGLSGPFLLTIILTLGLCSFWLLIDKENPSTILINRWSPIQLAAILTLVFLGVAAAAWAAYWTGSIFIAVLIYAGLVIPLALLDSAGWINYSTVLYENYVMASAALLICAALALAIHRKHLSATRIGIAILIASAFSFAFWFASYWDDIWSTHDVKWSLINLPEHVLLALFIALPVATIPLTLHAARHR